MRILEKLSAYYPHDEEMKEFLIHNTETVEVKKNEVLSKQNRFNRNIYFVEEGLLRTFYYEKGKEITHKFYTEGQLIAHTDTLFNDEASRYNVEALEDSELLTCNYEKLEEFCEKSINAANFSRVILGKLLTQLSERVASLQYMTAKEKYEQMMEEHPNLILRAPLGMIAGYLGISQETLSRIRGKK